MNPYDKKNLDFLMHASPDILTKWYAEVSKDDIQYAIELIRTARLEMSLQELDIAEYAMPESEDFSDAKEALSKFTLKGSK